MAGMRQLIWVHFKKFIPKAKILSCPFWEPLFSFLQTLIVSCTRSWSHGAGIASLLSLRMDFDERAGAWKPNELPGE
jgi:hypothetical protein